MDSKNPLQQATVFIAQTLAYLGNGGNLDIMANPDSSDMLIAEMRTVVNEDNISEEKMRKYFEVAEILIRTVVIQIMPDEASTEEIANG